MRYQILVAALIGTVSIGSARASDWSGFYAGIIGSAGELSSSGIHLDFPTNGRGTVGGLYAGYSFDAGAYLLGAELAVFGGAKTVNNWESELSGIHYYHTDTLDRGPLLTANARFGLPVGDFLFSVSGGLAAAETTAQRVSVDSNGLYQPSFNFQGGAKHIGYNVSASVETTLAEHFTLGAEYRYVNLGEQLYLMDNGGSGDISLTEHRVGLRLGIVIP